MGKVDVNAQNTEYRQVAVKVRDMKCLNSFVRGSVDEMVSVREQCRTYLNGRFKTAAP